MATNIKQVNKLQEQQEFPAVNDLLAPSQVALLQSWMCDLLDASDDFLPPCMDQEAGLALQKMCEDLRQGPHVLVHACNIFETYVRALGRPLVGQDQQLAMLVSIWAANKLEGGQERQLWLDHIAKYWVDHLHQGDVYVDPCAVVETSSDIQSDVDVEALKVIGPRRIEYIVNPDDVRCITELYTYKRYPRSSSFAKSFVDVETCVEAEPHVDEAPVDTEAYMHVKTPVDKVWRPHRGPYVNVETAAKAGSDTDVKASKYVKTPYTVQSPDDIETDVNVEILADIRDMEFEVLKFAFPKLRPTNLMDDVSLAACSLCRIFDFRVHLVDRCETVCGHTRVHWMAIYHKLRERYPDQEAKLHKLLSRRALLPLAIFSATLWLYIDDDRVQTSIGMIASVTKIDEEDVDNLVKAIYSILYPMVVSPDTSDADKDNEGEEVEVCCGDEVETSSGRCW